MRGVRILITGGAGFIGSHLAEKLLNEGHRITIVDDFSTGRIENLTVVSGPLMLRQAAMDAVKTWRYRPYLLNGTPVAVETQVTVNFTLMEN